MQLLGRSFRRIIPILEENEFDHYSEQKEFIAARVTSQRPI